MELTWMIAALCFTIAHLQRSRCNDIVPEEDGDTVFEAMSISALEWNRTQPMERVVSNMHMRYRRAADNRDVRGYSEEEKRILVSRHNTLRMTQRAADMMYMYWDEGLEATAQKYAEKCNFKHSQDRKDIKTSLDTFSVVGENLYASTGTYDARGVVQAWYDEIKYYDYNTGNCRGVCGHYTQVVWASSYALGCGVVYCPVLRNVNFGRGFNVVCHYGPAGNYIGVKPFVIGQPQCSQCGQEAPFCVNEMCARYPVIGGGGPEVTSRGHPSFNVIGYSVILEVLPILMLLNSAR